MKKCDICGYSNEDTQMFCKQCGNKLFDSPPQNNQYQQQPNLNQYNPQQNQNTQNNAQGTFYQPPQYQQQTQSYSQPYQQHYENAPIPPQTKKAKKGKGCLITVLIVVVILALMFLFANINNSNEAENTNSKSTTSQTTTESNEEKAENGLYVLDNSELKYVSAKIVSEDYGDSHYLIVNYEYKNTSEKNIAFYYDVTTQAFQNGVELQSPISTYGIHDFDFHNTEKEIKPGATIEIQEAFEISNYDDKVTIEIFDNLFSDKADYSFEINPKEIKD